MRDLVFKNLTKQENRRKILSSSETVDKDGVRTVVRRHFVYMVREAADQGQELEKPYLCVYKERNTRERLERFYCRMKGAMIVASQGKFFKINFMHSLRINLCAIPGGLTQYEPSESF